MASVKKKQDTSALFSDLAKLEKSQDFEKALKVCNKILNLAPTDSKAFHCKMVCLLQLGKFDSALQQIRENSHMDTDLSFEESYALYRLNRTLESLEVLDNLEDLEFREKELKAQILYRLERYQECYDLYKEIIKNTSDAFETERLANLSAVTSNLVKTKKVSMVESEESYELCYNKACYLLSQGKWLEAEKALNKSLKMCVEFLEEEEDVDEEDIEKEIGILKVQAGFAIQMQGREKEAQTIYNQVLKTKPSDIGIVAVASNNIITLNKDQNIFDSKKRIKAATSEDLEHKLTSSHRFAIARNNALLAMYTNQVDLCLNLIKEVGEKFKISVKDKTLIEAGVLSRAGKVSQAVDLLLKGEGSKDLERILIAVQIYLEKGEVSKAAELLGNLPNSEKYRIGILSTLVTLYLALENREMAAKLLKDTVEWNKSSKSKGDMATVWRKTAEFHLKGDDANVAAQALEELLKGNPNDRQTLAQLVLAYSRFDLKKALTASKKLPSFNHGSVDVDALDNSTFLGAKYGKKGLKSGGVASPKPKTPIDQEDDNVLLKKKKKKKRRKKLPKDYNPNVDPDPERWLPRRERTGYRKTRKERRAGEKFKGAQGTAAGQSENFDYSQKKAGAVPKQPLKSPQPEPVPGPRQQHKRPQQKKKAKKNRF